MFTEKGKRLPISMLVLFKGSFCVSLNSYQLVTYSTGNDATLNGGRGILLLLVFRNSK
jgi:hypothetical protein